MTIEIRGITQGYRTLTLVTTEGKSWYDFDKNKYHFQEKGKEIKTFDEQSQFEEAVTNLKQNKLGKILYNNAITGNDVQVKLDNYVAETGLEIPAWLN